MAPICLPEEARGVSIIEYVSRYGSVITYGRRTGLNHKVSSGEVFMPGLTCVAIGPWLNCDSQNRCCTHGWI